MNSNNIDDIIKNIDVKINQIEANELKGKSVEEQRFIKQKWENERNTIKKESQEKYKEFDEKYKGQTQNELQSIDDMQKDIAEFKQYLEDDFQKAMDDVNSVLNEMNKSEKD